MELASGVDALYLSAHAPLGEALLLRLAEARELADVGGFAGAVPVRGRRFLVEGHSFGRYRYQLSHRYGQVDYAQGRKCRPYGSNRGPSSSTGRGR